MDFADSLKNAARLVRRNFISVLFPTITVLCIYADLRRTAHWKRQLAEEQKQ